MEDRCKEKISLEDYWDFIISPYREGELEGVDTEKMCIQELDFGYKSVSLDSRMLSSLILAAVLVRCDPQVLYTSGYAAVRCSRNYYIAELSDAAAYGRGDYDRFSGYGDRLYSSGIP